MTPLGEAAAWHEQQVAGMRRDYETLAKLGVPMGKNRAEKIAMHERFARAIREADNDEPQRNP